MKPKSFNYADYEALQAKLEAVIAESKALRNELCLKCGNYRESHLGKCDWCKWKKG